MTTITAEAFVNAFTSSYQACQNEFNDETWQATWGDTDAWSHLILSRPPQKCVLQMTAEELRVEYWPREPMHLDGVFWPADGIATRTVRGSIPIPILVALEHENNISSFSEEIAKLLYVRAPLKVGITYILRNGHDANTKFQQEQSRIIREAAGLESIISQWLPEQADAEYLYLVGVEHEARQLEWWYYKFNANNGPNSGTWQKAAQHAAGAGR